MKDPAFLFYSSDFLTGVIDLTMEERGQYITLLCLQHQKGHLSEKTIRLSVGSISVDVRNKFALDDKGCLYNEVLEKYIEERIKFTESRRINGLKGGRPKKEKKPLGLPSANLDEDENEIENKDALILNIWSKDYFDIKFINSKSLETYDKLLRIDKYTIEQIKNVIKFARNDSFWGANFLTPNKLREKNKEGVKYIDVFLAKIKPVQQKSTFIPSPR